MSKQKLTTEEILALARQQNAGDDSDEPQSVAEPAAPAAEESPAAVEFEPPAKSPAKPAAKTPGSTADILAAARAQAKPATAEPAAKPAATSKPAAKPTSTADILAAARGQAKGAAKAAPAAAAEKKASPKSATVAAAAGERPSVQEMLKAARGGATAETAVAAPTKPTLPPRPAKPSLRKGAPVPRRNFLLALVATPFAVAWTAFTTATLAAVLGTARFAMPNVLLEPPSKFKIGPPEDYPMGTVSTKWKSEFSVWLTHVDFQGQPMIYALSTVCTHLGCTPNWLEGEQKFKCPCHGSGFYSDGVNFEGPAPRPLERYGIRLAADGALEIDKSVKFQEEMGQWEDPASFFPTA